MPADIRCLTCGESEALRGERNGDVIHVTCERCGETWPRDLNKRCDKCGDVLRPVPKVVAAPSRGNQKSIAGSMTVYVCPSCDKDLLERHLRSRSPIAPDEWSSNDSRTE
ncbi:MAG: hypothetical protein WD646_04970 [Actinomycetota bacterium]